MSNKIKCKSFRVTQNKYIEIQIGQFQPGSIINFTIQLNTKQDHAGLYVYCELFGYHLIMSFYDRRHWNHLSNDWEFYER